MRFISTILGVLLGVAAIASAIGMTAVDAHDFLDVPSLIFVIGGTFAATLISYPLSHIGHACKTLALSFGGNHEKSIKAMVRNYAQFIILLKSGNIQEIEQAARRISNPYLQTAAQMLRDGALQDDIARVLRWKIDRSMAEERSASDVFRAMAAFAPAFGMMGTLLGLVSMLAIMDSGDFGTIGAQMGLALLTTFYGLILANMVFKPCAVKIDQKLREDTVMMNIASEAVYLLSAKDKTHAYAKDILDSLISAHMTKAHDQK